jgi:hypothetical protein
VAGQAEKEPAKVSGVPVLFVLHKKRGGVAAHVEFSLLSKRCVFCPMVVPDDCKGFVLDRVSGGEQAVPQFGVFTASRGSRAEAFVEKADLIKYLPSKCHVGSGSDLPDGNAPATHVLEKFVIEPEGAKPAAESAEVAFELNLGFGIQPAGENETGGGRHGRIGEDPANGRQPLGGDEHVVVGPGQEVSGGGPDPGIAGATEAGAGFFDTDDSGKIAHHTAGFGFAGSIVDDENFIGGWIKGDKIFQTASQRFGAGSGADQNRYAKQGRRWGILQGCEGIFD